MGVKNLLIFDRMLSMLGSDKDKDLATYLGISPQAVSNARNKGEIPSDMILVFAEKSKLSVDWLLTGKGAMKRDAVYQAAESYGGGDTCSDKPLPFTDLPDINQRLIQLPGLLDLDDEEFCQKLGTDVSELDKVKAGRPVSGLLIRAVAYEFGVRMRWLKMGEQPIRNLSGAPDHFAQEMWGLIQQAAKKPQGEG